MEIALPKMPSWMLNVTPCAEFATALLKHASRPEDWCVPNKVTEPMLFKLVGEA